MLALLADCDSDVETDRSPTDTGAVPAQAPACNAPAPSSTPVASALADHGQVIATAATKDQQGNLAQVLSRETATSGSSSSVKAASADAAGARAGTRHISSKQQTKAGTWNRDASTVDRTARKLRFEPVPSVVAPMRPAGALPAAPSVRMLSDDDCDESNAAVENRVAAITMSCSRVPDAVDSFVPLPAPRLPDVVNEDVLRVLQQIYGSLGAPERVAAHGDDDFDGRRLFPGCTTVRYDSTMLPELRGSGDSGASSDALSMETRSSIDFVRSLWLAAPAKGGRRQRQK